MNSFAELLKNKIITPIGVCLYYIYRDRIGETCKLSEIKRLTGFSSPAILANTNMLLYLGLLEIEIKKDKATKRNSQHVKAVYDLTEKTIALLLDDPEVITYTNSNKIKYSSSFMDRVSMNKNVTLVFDILGDSVKNNFKKTHWKTDYTKQLDKMAKEGYLEKYTKWFRLNKLPKITNFNFGIFLYSPLINEFLAVKEKMEKVASVKEIKKKTFSEFKEIF